MSTTGNNGKWREVKKSDPCPACGGDHWCAFSPDGGMLKCERVTDAPHGMRLVKLANGGALFAPADDRPATRAAARKPIPATPSSKTNWPELARRFAAALTADRVTSLAAELGVSAAALKALGIGWASRDELKALGASGAGWFDDYPDSAFSFPERDGTGAMVGFSFRAADGRKGAPSKEKSGAARGLIVPATLAERADPVLLVEGASDVAACETLGLAAVGRPSNTAGVELLARLLPGRAAVVAGERDQKLDGRWPGRDGAVAVAGVLALKWRASVQWTLPPEGAKDVRAWLQAKIAAGLDLADADACCAAGAELLAALLADAHTIEPRGAISPESGGAKAVSGRWIVDPRHTPPIARAFIDSHYTDAAGAVELCHYGGMFLRHAGTAFVEVEDAALRHKLYPYLENEVEDADGKPIRVNFNTVNAVVDALRAHVHLAASITPPAWLRERADLPTASELIACKSKLLHLPTMRFIDPTADFFTTCSLSFDPIFDAPPPARWHAFLAEIFGDDEEQKNALQEWFGYCISCDTSQHKIGLIVGPRRSGKGTIARLLAKLIGESNVCGPTTSSLAGAFGLQSLIAMSLAIIADARFHGEGVSTAIERLLTISGEDRVTVDRKHRESITLKLPTRFLILSNELPRLHDSSAAIASRFLVFTLSRSFYGVEDTTLTERLTAELPAIFLWAVEGWRRLRERGRFIQPAAGVEAQRQIEDLSSPVGAFVRELCVVGSGRRAWCDDLFTAWRNWCQSEGRDAVGTKQSFGRDLAAVCPGVKRQRGTANVPFYAGIGIEDGATVANRHDGKHCTHEKEQDIHAYGNAMGTVAAVRDGAAPVEDLGAGCSDFPEDDGAEVTK
ncbi:MAG: DUF5906 domain-containing protein [Planctomycetes bacterium]|nr:DUF5906 domain-containing protein [Planctomycetota bacterium]